MNKLNTKDFISIGVFNAIFLVLFLFIFFTVGLIPIVSLFTSAFVALVSGAIFLLMAYKISKPGLFLISSILQSIIFLLLGGFNFFMLLFTGFLIIGGLLAEAASWMGRYRSLFGWGAGYVLYMGGITAGFWAPLYWWKDKFKQLFSEIALLESITGLFVAAIMMITVVAAIAGIAIGQKLVNRHLKKSGLIHTPASKHSFIRNK